MFVLIIILLFSYFAFPPSIAQKTPPELCAGGVHAILIRGQGPGDHLNVMVSMQNLVLQLIPNSSSVALPFHHGGSDHRIVAAEGALMMQDYIRQYVASCPQSKIFLMGYSLGGIVMMDGLCGTSSLWLNPVPGLEPKYNRNGPHLSNFPIIKPTEMEIGKGTERMIAAAAYGEETFIPGMPWNIGTCTNGVGLYPRIHPEWCDPFAASIREYCDTGDNSCCMQYPPIDDGAHFYYIFRYNMDLLHFVQRRLAETPVP
ncbi:hypothetical protein N7456_011858 [Penicillium angulare]|uniref:Uncharacterized protein n=1 Tax=Penicillium angulare TaxID=116970 RepID=A0A9W9EUG0_9EURO|nr:hypothetical protein N7456_011858 [Penicillium angulare]